METFKGDFQCLYENFQWQTGQNVNLPKGKFAPLDITQYGPKGCVHVLCVVKKLKHNPISHYIYSALLNYLLKVI